MFITSTRVLCSVVVGEQWPAEVTNIWRKLLFVVFRTGTVRETADRIQRFREGSLYFTYEPKPEILTMRNVGIYNTQVGHILHI